ncbi:MAG: hypothetical protein ABI823_14790 [Bryobacteraceae bacterium]
MTALLFALLSTSMLPGQTGAKSAAPPDVNQIVRRSLERDRFNFERAKDYTYRERSEVRSLDSSGKVNNREIETNDVMILVGRPYQRLIAKDDKPLSAKEEQKEQEKIDKELARRQRESEKDRNEAEKRRRETRRFLDEFMSVFDLKLVGDELWHGSPVWVIEATARPGYKARERMAKIMQKVHGKIWIDKSDFNWVKFEAVTTDTISVGLALFRLGPGTKILFEQTRVNNEIWLPSHLRVTADARIGYIRRFRRDIEITYSDHRKFQTDSRLVTGDQLPAEKQVKEPAVKPY